MYNHPRCLPSAGKKRQHNLIGTEHNQAAQFRLFLLGDTHVRTQAAKKDWEANSALRLRDSDGAEGRRWWEGGTGDDSEERESEDVPQSEGAPRSVGVRREEGRGKLAVVPASSLTVSEVGPKNFFVRDVRIS